MSFYCYHLLIFKRHLATQTHSEMIWFNHRSKHMGADHTIVLLYVGRWRLREFKLFSPTVLASYTRQIARCFSCRALAVCHYAPHHNMAFPNMVIPSSAGFNQGEKSDSTNMILKALKHLLHVGTEQFLLFPSFWVFFIDLNLKTSSGYFIMLKI